MHGLLGLAGIIGLVAFAFGQNVAVTFVRALFILAGFTACLFAVDVLRSL